jgi:hypothetical protein
MLEQHFEPDEVVVEPMTVIAYKREELMPLLGVTGLWDAIDRSRDA